MNKNFIFVFILASILSISPIAMAQPFSNEDILKELRILKARVEKLENELRERDAVINQINTEQPWTTKTEIIIEEMDEDENEWEDRISISGLVELEYGNDSHNIKDPVAGFSEVRADSSDFTLATLELGIDAGINEYVKAHVLLLYEEDDTEDFSVDEGTIILGGTESTHGLHLMGGKYYPRFGELHSSFISDPLTLELFEINESAFQAGFDNEWISLNTGVFHGDVENRFSSESKMNSFFADINLHPAEEVLSGLTMLIGLSYMNNVSDSDTLQEEVQDLNSDGVTNDLMRRVDGIAAYLVAEYGGIGLSAEYITALKRFKAGEMGYAIDRNGTMLESEPGAWNFELTYRLREDWLVGAKYEGSADMFGLFPEKQYGIVTGWSGLPYLTLSAEYLHGEYDENNRNADGLIEDDRDLITVQVAMEF
ncbi:LbtU family siderophore porin [Thermodesulfobacteriota bacterium]